MKHLCYLSSVSGNRCAPEEQILIWPYRAGWDHNSQTVLRWKYTNLKEACGGQVCESLYRLPIKCVESKAGFPDSPNEIGPFPLFEALDIAQCWMDSA